MAEREVDLNGPPTLQYHGGARGLASLNFPGFGSACILEEEKEDEGNGGHGRDVGINR